MRCESVPNCGCEMLNRPLPSLCVGGTKRIFWIPVEKGRHSAPLPGTTPSQAVQDGNYLVGRSLHRPCAPLLPDLPNSLPSKSIRFLRAKPLEAENLS